MVSERSAVVLLNPRARGGRGLELWKTVESSISNDLAANVVMIDERGDWSTSIADAVERDVRVFIAAGGDGTVHALVNALFSGKASALNASRPPIIGAVGLGSSNDFHKPYTHSSDIPKRISASDARPRDLGKAFLYLGEAEPAVRYFAVSASAGATADGNAYFNQGTGMVGLLKGKFTSLAIGLSVLRTIATHRPVPCVFEVGPPEIEQCMLSNLSVLKVPYLSGSLHYDLPVEPADGLLTAALWREMSRLEVLTTVASLIRGKYPLSNKRLYWKAPSIQLTFPHVVPIELDGEIYEADRVRFEVVPNAVRECRPTP